MVFGGFGIGLAAVLAVAALSACGSSEVPRAKSAAAASDGAENRFYSPAAGISIDKRPSWFFMPLDLELANRKAVSVGKEETDAAMHDSSTPPLVVIARYPEPSEKPNSTLKINLRALGGLKGFSALQITQAVADSMMKAIPSFELDGGVRAVQVSGLEAGTFRAHFTLVVPRLERSFSVKTQAWIVPRGEDGISIVASDPSGGAEDNDADFQAMVATIRIRK
jgi:hypothetical protein